VYVSHRLDEVHGLADRVVVFKDGSKAADLPTKETSTRWLAELITGLTAESQAADEAHEAVSEDVLLAVRDLASPPLLSVSFDLDRGELLGVAGLLGSCRVAANFAQISVGKIAQLPSKLGCVQSRSPVPRTRRRVTADPMWRTRLRWQPNTESARAVLGYGQAWCAPRDCA